MNMEAYLKRVGHLILIASIILTSCARQSISFDKSNIVPAASGDVKIKRDNNSNYSVRLKIVSLAPASRLSPPKDHYVLWMESDGNRVQNLGRLISSKPLFSKAFKAKLNTSTTYKPTKFFITAENGFELEYPQGPSILTTESLH
jgi:hypothetical protein